MTAHEAWRRMVVGRTGEQLTAEPFHGMFAGYRGRIVFACPEGCCEDRWSSMEGFVREHDGTQFKSNRQRTKGEPMK